MADYIKVFRTSDEKEVNEYINKGWEIINTGKVVQIEGSEYLRYNLGYPAKAQLAKLTAIIKEYEKYGLKEILFEKVAAENDESLDEYESDGVYPSTTPLTEYMSNYEEVVNDEKVSYYSKQVKEQQELKFKRFLED